MSYSQALELLLAQLKAGDIVRVNSRPDGCPTRWTRTAQVLFVDKHLKLARVRFLLNKRSFGVHLVPLANLKRKAD